MDDSRPSLTRRVIKSTEPKPDGRTKNPPSDFASWLGGVAIAFAIYSKSWTVFLRLLHVHPGAIAILLTLHTKVSQYLQLEEEFFVHGGFETL